MISQRQSRLGYPIDYTMNAIEESGASQHSDYLLTHSAPEKFSIRALNMDNYRDAIKLSELMAACSGQVPPEMSASQFWFEEQSALLESGNLVHAVAVHNGQHVAHIGLRYYGSSKTVRVLFPVVRSGYRPYCLRIMRAFWRELERLFSQQGVRAAFFYCPMSEPFQQLVGTKCFRTKAVALIPAITGADNRNSCHLGTGKAPGGIVVLQYLPDVSPGEQITIYPPTSHFSHIQQSYDALGLKRVFSFSRHSTDSSLDCTGSPKDDSPLSRTSVAGLRISFLPDINLYQFTVFPSNVENATQAIRRIEDLAGPRISQGRISSIHVALDDQSCPSFCRVLEERKYRFSGILPRRDERDYVLYSQFTDELLTKQLLYPKEARSLRSYISESL